jgi:sulfatase maturation enzyme AslB (radical SAM superfamily)
MKLSSTLIRWIRNGLRYPDLILPFIKERLLPYMYHIGDGSWAYQPTVVKMHVTGSNNEPYFMSVEDCCRLMEDIKGYHPRINVCGAEPLLNEHIQDILTAIKTHRFSTKMCTNGILLSEFAEQIACIGVDSVWVSLDGIQPIHDTIRGTDVYNKAISGIRMLKQSREKYGKKVPRIGINFSINYLNYHNIVEFAELLFQKEKVDHININHPYFVTEAACKTNNNTYPWLGESIADNIKAMELDKIKTNVLWTQLERLKHKSWSKKISFNIEITSKEQLHEYYHHMDKVLKRKKCYLPWSSTMILANGDVMVSNRCLSYKVGNFHENSLREIWNGQGYKTFRRGLKEAGHFPVCSRCYGYGD